jgi:hypothetical protein
LPIIKKIYFNIYLELLKKKVYLYKLDFMRDKILIFTAIIFGFGLSSCKKDKSKSISESKCKIASIEYEYGEFFNLTYDGELVTKFKPTDKEYEYKLFYNSDKLLTLREFYSDNHELSDIDTFYYDTSKRLIAKESFTINKAGERLLNSNASYGYNSSNQIISSRALTIDEKPYLVVKSLEYKNNRISKEMVSEYEDGNFKEKLEYSYTYSNTPNSIYTLLKQSSLIFGGDPLNIGEFYVTDLLVSKVDLKVFNESDEYLGDFTTEFTYRFEDENLTFVFTYYTLLNFEYKCD